MTASKFAGLAEFRCIGPFRGVDVAFAEVGEEALEVGREFDLSHGVDWNGWRVG